MLVRADDEAEVVHRVVEAVKLVPEEEVPELNLHETCRDNAGLASVSGVGRRLGKRTKLRTIHQRALGCRKFTGASRMTRATTMKASGYEEGATVAGKRSEKAAQKKREKMAHKSEGSARNCR